MSVINWQYTRDPNDINTAIRNRDRDWEGLTSANQIINITFDSNHGCYVVFWRVKTKQRSSSGFLKPIIRVFRAIIYDVTTDETVSWSDHYCGYAERREESNGPS